MLAIIIRLFLLTLVPISISIGMRVVVKSSTFKRIKYIDQQIIIGLIFGLISIFGTICGVETVSGAVVNIRDVGPMCAGFIFGGLSGIIAGIIGGLYRFISALLGLSGTYTMWACSISTICAGIFTAIIRKYLFDNHHGKWYYGFGLGVLVESFHMLMVFFTHMGDIEQAYLTVANCATPMILVNSLAMLLSLLGVAFVSKEKLLDIRKPKKIATKVQVALLCLLTFSFLSISYFTNRSLNNINEKDTISLLSMNVNDVRKDVDDEIDRTLYEDCKDIKDDILTSNIESLSVNDANRYLASLTTIYNISEISLIDSEHVIKYTNSDFIGFDMDSGDQSKVFNDLVDKKEFMVQEYGPIQYDANIKRKYAGIRLTIDSLDIKYLQIGYSESDYKDVLENCITYSVSNRHVGNNGYILILNEYGDILSKYNNLELDNDFNNSINNLEVDTKYTINININGSKNDMYCYIKNVNGYYIVGLANKYNCDLNTNISSMAITLTSLFVFLVLYCVIYVMIKKEVVDGVINIQDSLNKISDGDLEISCNERNSFEFNDLSDDINKTVNTLKDLVNKEAKRIDDELMFAKTIQASSLPSKFPAFTTIPSVDLYALMKTAKEVGGDFYDFYKVGEDKIAILIADVSGKGIPAAMFMMKAKAIIKNLAKSNLEVNEVFNEANIRLCEDNSAQMFVTAFLAFINTKTGHVEYCNAGHNPPILLSKSNASFIKSKPGFILGGLESVKYSKFELDLDKNDCIFLYTDGITEANDINNKLYGEERLLNLFNNIKYSCCNDICNIVLNDVNKYSYDTIQSDDITMLAFIYK